MASPFEQSDFVDSDYEAAKRAGLAGSAEPSPMTSYARPPSREELDGRVSDAQVKLAELKRAQEELERERASLEEARRRRVEYQTGREEMLQHLTRGLGLLEESEFAARREAEQMTKTLVDLRDALAKVQALNEETWTSENWNLELTRALTTLENARMEWNAARLKWSVLNGQLPANPSQPGAAEAKNVAPAWQDMSFGELCRIGFALNWPSALLALGLLLFLLVRR